MRLALRSIQYLSYLALAWVLITILTMLGALAYWNREYDRASRCLSLCIMLRLAAHGREP